jgi:uncharacterized membrane protein YfcA
MYVRRLRYQLRDIRWWAIFALLGAALTVTLASYDEDLELVIAVGVATITLAILSLKETT